MLIELSVAGAAIGAVMILVRIARRRRERMEWKKRDKLCQLYGDYQPHIDICEYSASTDPLDGGIVRRRKRVDEL